MTVTKLENIKEVVVPGKTPMAERWGKALRNITEGKTSSLLEISKERVQRFLVERTQTSKGPSLDVTPGLPDQADSITAKHNLILAVVKASLSGQFPDPSELAPILVLANMSAQDFQDAIGSFEAWCGSIGCDTAPTTGLPADGTREHFIRRATGRSQSIRESAGKRFVDAIRE